MAHVSVKFIYWCKSHTEIIFENLNATNAFVFKERGNDAIFHFKLALKLPSLVVPRPKCNDIIQAHVFIFSENLYEIHASVFEKPCKSILKL